MTQSTIFIIFVFCVYPRSGTRSMIHKYTHLSILELSTAWFVHDNNRSEISSLLAPCLPSSLNWFPYIDDSKFGETEVSNAKNSVVTWQSGFSFVRKHCFPRKEC